MLNSRHKPSSQPPTEGSSQPQRKVWPLHPVRSATHSYHQLGAVKGRGATGHVASRFDQDQRQQDLEYLDHSVQAGGQEPDANTITASPQVTTSVTFETAKKVIARNQSPDIPFEVSVNPYRGCEHGCIYCYARPTHSYLGMNPSLDFETRLIAKRNVAEQLAREIAAPSYVPSYISVGSATDCYQPIERDLKLTRSVLQVLHDARHPFALVTKSSLVERDVDLIAPMSALGLGHVAISITTLDHTVSRKLEPRAASPARRLQTIEFLARAGVSVSVAVAPIIPFVTDDQLERILQAAANAGAKSAHYTVIRLPWEIDPLFNHWLEHHFPERAQRVMQRIRDLRGGKNYDANFAHRMKGQGIWAELIRQRFDGTARRLGLLRQRPDFDLNLFKPHMTQNAPTAQPQSQELWPTAPAHAHNPVSTARTSAAPKQPVRTAPSKPLAPPNPQLNLF